MDLSVVQDILNNVATFGKNIEAFLQGPIEIIKTLGAWFSPEVSDAIVDDEGNPVQDDLASAWETTAGILGSSK